MDKSVMQSARYEIKMTCDEMYLPDVRSWLRLHPDGFADTYPLRQVNNLYLDTSALDCLNDNLTGASQRSKLRFRWYGKDRSSVPGVLELKCKSNQLSWKERWPVPVTFDLTTISWRDLIRQMQERAKGVFAVWLSCIVRPTLLNSYTREYYESMDRQIRVTIDYDQKVYEQITHPELNLTFSTPIERRIVIEVKSDPALYRRVSNVLSSFPLRVERNSKYVNGLIESLCFV